MSAILRPSVTINQPTVAVFLGAAQCETGCGRLVFTANDTTTRRRVLLELDDPDEADAKVWTYPEHTPEVCRAWRALT